MMVLDLVSNVNAGASSQRGTARDCQGAQEFRVGTTRKAASCRTWTCKSGSGNTAMDVPVKFWSSRAERPEPRPWTLTDTSTPGGSGTRTRTAPAGAQLKACHDDFAVVTDRGGTGHRLVRTFVDGQKQGLIEVGQEAIDSRSALPVAQHVETRWRNET